MDEALTDRQSVFHQFECICSFRGRISNGNGLRKRVTLLDRKDLENEYFNIYDEASQLKTLINIQQDKIKKLLTKLVRTANQQKRINSLQKSSISLNKNTPEDQTDRINELENSNQKLVSKINSLKLQLLTQKNISVYKKVSKKNQIRNGNGKSLTTRTMTQNDNDALKEISESENNVQIDETIDKQAKYIITLEDKVDFLQNLIEKMNSKNNEKIKEFQNELGRLQTKVKQKENDSDTAKYKQGCICEKYAHVEMMNNLLKEQLEGALNSNSNLMDQLREERKRIVAQDTKLFSSDQVRFPRNNEDGENFIKLREKEERMQKAAAQFQKEKEKMMKEIQDIKMTSEAINGVNSGLNLKISDMQAQIDIMQIQSAGKKSSEIYPVEYDTNPSLDNIPQKETMIVKETEKEVDCQIENIRDIIETRDEGDLEVPEVLKVEEDDVLIVNPTTPEETTSIINHENGMTYSHDEDSPHEQRLYLTPNKSILEVLVPHVKEPQISQPKETTRKDSKYRIRRPSYSYSSRSKFTNTYSDETSLTHNDFTEDSSSTSISLGEVDSDNRDVFNLDESEINSTTDVIKKALTHIVQELRIYTNMFDFNDIKNVHREKGLANKQVILQERKDSDTLEENLKANNTLGEIETARLDLEEPKRVIDDTRAVVKSTATETAEIKEQLNKTAVRDDSKYAEGMLILHFAKILLDLRKTTRLKEDSFIFLTWQFYDKSSKFTPIKSCRDATFDFSATYDLEFSPQLVQYLKNNTLTIELHHTVEDHSETLTKCMLPLGPVLESPNTLVPLELVIEGFGKLECDFIIRLRNEDIKELRILYNQAPVEELNINESFLTV